MWITSPITDDHPDHLESSAEPRHSLGSRIHSLETALHTTRSAQEPSTTDEQLPDGALSQQPIDRPSNNRRTSSLSRREIAGEQLPTIVARDGFSGRGELWYSGAAPRPGRENSSRARLVAISPIGGLARRCPSARFASAGLGSRARRGPNSGGVTGRALDDSNAPWTT